MRDRRLFKHFTLSFHRTFIPNSVKCFFLLNCLLKTMVVTCIIFSCGSRADRNHNLSFFRIPSIKRSVHYPHLNELSKKRREMWIAAIGRSNLTESILKYQRVCSKHFITGKPSVLTDEDHPDWVPSQHLGYDLDYECQAVLKRKTDVDGKMRLDKRRKLTQEKLATQ